MIGVGKKRFIVILAIIVCSLFLASCTLKQQKATPDTKYFTGYKGVEMEFSKALPPDKLYFYSTQQDNTFDIGVETTNAGSSWSRGAVFVSGYDPTLINIQGITPDRSSGGNCKLNIGNIAYGKFGGSLVCDNFVLSMDKSLQHIELCTKNLGSKVDMGRLTGGIDFCYQKNGDDWVVDFSNDQIDADYANHGRLLIALMYGLDFSKTFGEEYLLAGNTYEYPGGEKAFITFNGNIATWPQGLDKTEQTFMITNCYMYTTYAAPVVCIDPSPFSENQKVCTPKSYTGTSGQGAPVAITSIEQENTARQAIFTINIRNTGGGQVYDPGALEKCSPYSPGRVTSQDLNIVYLGDKRVSGDLMQLRCTPNDFIRLDPKTGTGVVTCVYDIPYSSLKSAYQAPLVVELWYGYSKTIQKRVTIKRAE